MVSTIVSVIIYGLYSWGVVSPDDYVISDTINIFCSTITQAMICYIIWNIDNIKPPVVRGISEHDEI